MQPMLDDASLIVAAARALSPEPPPHLIDDDVLAGTKSRLRELECCSQTGKAPADNDNIVRIGHVTFPAQGPKRFERARGRRSRQVRQIWFGRGPVSPSVSDPLWDSRRRSRDRQVRRRAAFPAAARPAQLDANGVVRPFDRRPKTL